MINYQDCLHYYSLLLQASEADTTYAIVNWYQNKCRFYGDET